MTCDTCGATLELGSWPWCPHERAANAVIPDDVPGGFWVENGFDKPTWFPSHSAHEAALAARGMEIRAKWAGPTDKHLKRWDVPSAKTLEDAKILLERGMQAARDERARLEAQLAEFPITVTTLTEAK